MGECVKSSNRGRKHQTEIDKREINKRMSKKLVGMFVAVILILVGIFIRIIFILATNGKQYNRIVLKQTQRKYENESRVIPFQRGDILDRNGTILATSKKVYNVIVDCKAVNDIRKGKEGDNVPKYLEPTIKALVKVLNLEEKEIRSKLDNKERGNSQYQVLKSNLSLTAKEKFEE